MQLEPGQPCRHPGCAAHLSHPCEGCGRYGAGLAPAPTCKRCGGDRLVHHWGGRRIVASDCLDCLEKEQTDLYLVGKGQDRILKLAVSNTILHGAYHLARQHNWTWDQTLTFMVIGLARENKALQEKTWDLMRTQTRSQESPPK